MRLSPLCFLVFGASVKALSLQSVLIANPQPEGLEVPGQNTLIVGVESNNERVYLADMNSKYCKDPSDYIFNIDYIDLSPNPPEQ